MDEFDLFTQALEFSDPREQAAFLDLACADVPALRQRVQALLANHTESGSFLARPAADVAEFVYGSDATGKTSAANREDVPMVLGSYAILEQIGKGGMGTVYKARHTRLDRMVALKLLPSCRSSSTDALDRFDREMQAVGKLDHPHLVRAFDAGDVDSHRYLTMELIEGCDLAQLVNQNGPLPVSAACELTRQAASGLQAIHELGMIHRDIKPANLMLNSEGTLKILDLGLALFQDFQSVAEKELTGEGQIMGTMAYLAPEQCEDSHNVDIRADLYSLGATLYFLLTGKTLFADCSLDTPIQHLNAILNATPTPVIEYRVDLPLEISSLLSCLLSKDPAERLASPAEVEEILRPFCQDGSLAGFAFRHTGASVETDNLVAHTTGQVVQSRLEVPPAVPRKQHAVPDAKTSRIRRCLPPFVLIASLLVPLIWLYGTMVYRFVANEGFIEIEVNDPAIEVRVRHGQLTLRDRTTRRKLVITAGEGELEVFEKGSNGPLLTKQFRLSRGGRTTVRITMKELEAARNANPASSVAVAVSRVDAAQNPDPWIQIKSLHSGKTLNNFAIQDFTGDGVTDILYTDGGTWTLYPSTIGNKRGILPDWESGARPVMRSTLIASYMYFGDFDGDNRCDAFFADGIKWNVWYSRPNGQWEAGQLQADKTRMRNLAVGDFVGDGRADVLIVFASDAKTSVSNGGIGGWQKHYVGAAGTARENMRFGDFNGDGKTDIFTNGSYQGSGIWEVLYSGTGEWQQVSDSEGPRSFVKIPLTQLRFGDFNGDKVTDVLYQANGSFHAAFGGQTVYRGRTLSALFFSHELTPDHGVDISQLGFGDLNGDGITDGFRIDASKWFVNYGIAFTGTE